MTGTTAERIDWRWDRGRNRLTASILTSNGQTVRVHFPLSHVAMCFDEELGRCGIVEAPMVGDYESVDGFLSRIKRVTRKSSRRVKKATRGIKRSAGRGFIPKAIHKRVVPKFVRRAQSRLNTAAWRAAGTVKKYGKKYGMKAARSRALGSALGATAVAFPAVGGPALGAWAVANRAVKAHDTAKAAARQLERGVRNPRAIAAAARGRAVQSAVRALPARQDPRSRMALAALRSVPAARYW